MATITISRNSPLPGTVQFRARIVDLADALRPVETWIETLAVLGERGDLLSQSFHRTYVLEMKGVGRLNLVFPKNYLSSLNVEYTVEKTY